MRSSIGCVVASLMCGLCACSEEPMAGGCADGLVACGDSCVPVGTACGMPDAGTNPVPVPQDMSATPDADVELPMLNLVAGGLGASGNLDGIGSAARFNQPFGMAADGAGNLYVADSANNLIRKVVKSSGVVTTLGGAAQLSGPRGVAFDGAGNLYIADAGSHTIRKMVIATGAVTTVAGMAGMAGSADGKGSVARFDSPSAVAFDGVNLYVADSGNHTIRQLVLSTGSVYTVAGTVGMPGSADGTGSAAQFNRPFGVALDGAGNLVIADTFNHTIRVLALFSRAVTTMAGAAGTSGRADGIGAAARFFEPFSVALDGAGNLYVADTTSHTIRKVVVSTAAVTTMFGMGGVTGSTDGTGRASRFNQPIGLVADGAGNLYAADSNNSTIRQVVLSSSAVTTLAGAAPARASVDGIGSAARFSGPRSMAFDGAENLYIADAGNHTIRKVETSTGAVKTLAGMAGMSGSTDGTGTAARFFQPYGVALDGTGNLYVTETFSHTIRKVELSTGAVKTLAGMAGMTGSTDGIGGAARFDEPSGVVVDGAGNLYVADSDNSTIRKVVLASGVVTTLAGAAGIHGNTNGTGNAARFNHPRGVALDGAGNLYVAESYNSMIRKVVLASGVVTTLAGAAGLPGSADGIGSAARFNRPEGVSFDGAGNLYVTEPESGTIRKIGLANADVKTLVGVAGLRGVKPGRIPASLNRPFGIVALAAGALYLTDYGENSLLEVR